MPQTIHLTRRQLTGSPELFRKFCAVSEKGEAEVCLKRCCVTILDIAQITYVLKVLAHSLMIAYLEYKLPCQFRGRIATLASSTS